MASCLMPLIINLTTLLWLPEDQKILDDIVSAGRCEKHYPELPCLVKFTKLGERDYYAICGRPRLKLDGFDFE